MNHDAPVRMRQGNARMESEFRRRHRKRLRLKTCGMRSDNVRNETLVTVFQGGSRQMVRTRILN